MIRNYNYLILPVLFLIALFALLHITYNDILTEGESHKKRVRAGGNRKTKFLEGWVEFSRKSTAKGVAISLNNTPVGGPKRSYWRDDIWNIKYLKGFKWDDLTGSAGMLFVLLE